jgi:glycosyltransferase involved in cell wall biosynthesis
MNILFISNDPQVFSDTSVVRERMRSYAAEIAKRGGMLHILSRSPADCSIQDGPLHLHGVAIGKLQAQSELPRIAKELIKAENIRIVSAQDPFEHGKIAARAVEGTPAKLHIQIHTDFLSPWFVRTGTAAGLLNRIRVRIAGDVLPKADGIRVVSERIRRSVMKRYKDIPEPSVIPIAVPQVAPSTGAQLPGNHSFKLVAVGRLEGEKRVQDLIAAMHALPRTVALHIVGDGSQRGVLEDHAFQEGLSSRIFFLGNRPDARSLMTQADVFVQASAYEGYGLTLIEAALAGIPIITTKVGIVGEVLDSETDIYPVPIADPAAISVQVMELTNNSEKGALHASCAKAHVEEHLSRTDSSPRAIIEDMARL